MSIINDALKKAQKSLDKKGQKDPYDIVKPENKSSTPSVTVNESASAPIPDTPSSSINNTKNLIIAIVAAFVIILILAIVLVILVKKTMPNLMEPSTTSSQQLEGKENKEPKKKQQAAKEIELKQIQSIEKTLKLDGTMMMGETRSALINGEVYKPGERINGLTVKTIKTKSVELEDSNGNMITIGVIK